MEIERLCIDQIKNVYTISTVKKEFQKAVNETWRIMPPLRRYQKVLLQDIAVLDEEKENAIIFPQFEKLKEENGLYSITHPKSRKNVRVIYTIIEGKIILLNAFLEKNKEDYHRAILVSRERRKYLLSD